MPKNGLIIRFFSSGMQAVAVQILGSAFFYIISVHLSKESFGLINWMNAIALFLTTLLGFGLEQVVTRRIAASTRSDWTAAAFLLHNTVGFLLTLMVLLLLRMVGHAGIYHYLPWFFAAQGLLFIAVPFKQFLNAKERFTPYGLIATASNAGKIVAAFWLLKINRLDTLTTAEVLIGAAFIEWCFLTAYVVSHRAFTFRFKFQAYTKLIKEASAQYLSVIFDMSLSRMDWILLGMLASTTILADYSFAYRAFELARLPMLIVGQLLLPRFARLMALNYQLTPEQHSQVNSFNQVEQFFVVMIPFVLNILWVPLAGWFTHGKYGTSNALQFMLLSLCIPLQFFINLLWSIGFGAKKYRAITTITITCAIINVLLNLFLIPHFKGTGAAISFFATTILQVVLYYRLTNKQLLSVSIKPMLFFALIASVICAVLFYLSVPLIIQLPAALVVYTAVAIFTGQISKKHLLEFKLFLS